MAAGVGAQHPAEQQASEMTKCRADWNLLIRGMSQLSCYLGVCQQVLQEGFWLFPFQQQIRGRKPVLSSLTCMDTESTSCSGKDQPKLSWELSRSGCLCPPWAKDFFPVGWDSLLGLSNRTYVWFRWNRVKPSQGPFQCLDVL